MRKSAMRVVKYPKELDTYVEEFYAKGIVFLTGEKNRYLEQRTYSNHLESAFKNYKLDGLTMSRIKKTYDEGIASKYLADLFHVKAEDTGTDSNTQLDERWLMKEMEHDLTALRSILGISCSDMGLMTGIASDEYNAIEAGEASMDWSMFMGLLFIFKYNRKTAKVVDALGLFPDALKEKITIAFLAWDVHRMHGMQKEQSLEGLESFDKEGIIDALVHELPGIREELSISADDLERMTNIGAKRISAIEDGRQKMKWSEYLTIIFVLWSNKHSQDILEEKEIFPIELRRAFSVNYNAH